MRKRLLPFFLAFLILLMAFTGCSTQNEASAGSSENQDQTSYSVNPSETDSEKTDDSTDRGNDSPESVVDDSPESSGDNSTPSGEQTDSDSDVPIVYFTSDISPAGLIVNVVI